MSIQLAPTILPNHPALRKHLMIELSDISPGHPSVRKRDASEWVLTNGLGGFAMGTVGALPQRRYHAWLVAALSPPVGRFATLHSAAERVFVEDYLGEQHWDVSSHQFAGGNIAPHAALAPSTFSHGLETRWTYDLAPGLTFIRTFALARHVNACVVSYELRGLRAGQKARLHVSPLVAMRDFHELLHAHHAAEHPHVVERPSPDELFVKRVGVRLHLRLPGSAFRPMPAMWRNFEYARDAARGQECHEDLFCPGHFEVALSASVPVQLRASVGAQIAVVDTDHLHQSEATRIDAITSVIEDRCGLPDRRLAEALALASDRFVVRRVIEPGKTFASVIAGYPWFSDWGRDTCVSIPGLLLTTGRHAEAVEALVAFASLRRRGLIPNCFANASGEPEYNTVDGPLWFLAAVCTLMESGGPRDAFTAHLLPACKEIIDGYLSGTEFAIGVDPRDGLIAAGDDSSQLTWMDAKRDGVVFTPRHGKPIEINALWCSSLRRLSLLVASSEPALARTWGKASEVCATSINEKFWLHDLGYLADVLGPGDQPSRLLRPNQLWAISLPLAPVTGQRALSVLQAVETRLLTPVGLRTLAAGEPGYQARFEGNLFERDRAYHNGTVWPWLLGPFCEAKLRASDFSAEAIASVRSLLLPIVTEIAGLSEAPQSRTILSYPEVFDADDPRRPDGCPMQAWSVAELMRVLALIRPRVA